MFYIHYLIFTNKKNVEMAAMTQSTVVASLAGDPLGQFPALTGIDKIWEAIENIHHG